MNNSHTKEHNTSRLGIIKELSSCLRKCIPDILWKALELHLYLNRNLKKGSILLFFHEIFYTGCHFCLSTLGTFLLLWKFRYYFNILAYFTLMCIKGTIQFYWLNWTGNSVDKVFLRSKRLVMWLGIPECQQ